MTARPRARLMLVLSAALVALAVAGAPGSAVLAKPGRDLAVAAPESVGVSSERLKRLDAGMQGLVTDGRLAGAVTLLTRRGKTVHVGVHGVKDIRSGAPMTRDAIFRIYSMTKPVTGVAMLMLYEEGKWRLEDPVSRFIPEFAKLKVWVGENPDGTPKVEDARRSMTMRELMTHYRRAGLRTGRQPRGGQAVPEGRSAQSAPAAADAGRYGCRVAAGGAAGDPLVVQRGGGRAGLPGREAVGPVVRRFPAHPAVRAAEDERHRLLRAEGEAVAAGAGPRRGRVGQADAARRLARRPHRGAGGGVRRPRPVLDGGGLRPLLRDDPRRR